MLRRCLPSSGLPVEFAANARKLLCSSSTFHRSNIKNANSLQRLPGCNSFTVSLSAPPACVYLSRSFSSVNDGSSLKLPLLTGSESYSSLLNTLYAINMHRKVRLGCENTAALIAILGPEYAPPSKPLVQTTSSCSSLPSLSSYASIHVAGSNGKGSVCWKISEWLIQKGLRVGVYTSPHISSFRERIMVNRQCISEKSVCDMLPHIINTCIRHDLPCTFFEITTVLAFRAFNAMKVDVAIIEVGLGYAGRSSCSLLLVCLITFLLLNRFRVDVCSGRLDSTNVICPSLSVITSISLEHCFLLGNNLALSSRFTRKCC